MAETDIWTIRAALDWTVGYLERKGDENPRLSAQWLLAEATGLSRIELYANFERPLSLDERDVLRGYVTRRGRGEPLQYITGEVGFRHITVKVRPGVLIPRPETEVLVSEALALLPAVPKRVAADSRPDAGAGAGDAPASRDADSSLSPGPGDDRGRHAAAHPADQGALIDALDSAEGEAAREPSVSVVPAELPKLLVADLCTGSGCIACSLAFEHPHVAVVATDIAPEAVALARENAAALDLADRVDVVACDLGEGVDRALMGAFDLVVSNPPYVPTAVLAGIPREVADFEPALALDGGPDGLDVLRRLLPWCRDALKPGGALAFELHETCLDEAARLATEAGFADARIVRDLADRPRVLVARKQHV